MEPSLDNPLILPLVPPTARPGVLRLWGFHHRFAGMAAAAGEPMIRQIKLAWWRDALSAMADGQAAPPEPLLQEAAQCGWPAETLAALAELADAHAAAVEADDEVRLGAVGRDLFALTQMMIHPAVAAVGAAGGEGHRWALAMAGMRQSAPEPRDTLFATAISAPVGKGAHRSLFAVARLAVAIAARGGMRSPAREQWLVLRTGLFGAMGLR